MGWVDGLKGSIVGLDTAPLIYFTEEISAYTNVVDPFFEALDRGEITVVTSVITLLEVLVHPLRAGNKALVEEYRDTLYNREGLQTFDINSAIAEEAAQLRALYKLRTADALQMATAINQKASFFLTNDIHLPAVPGLKMLVLDTLKAQSQGQP